MSSMMRCVEPRGAIPLNTYSRRTAVQCRAVASAPEPSSRRTALGNLAAATAALLTLPSFAAEQQTDITSTTATSSSSSSVYTDEQDGFSVAVPAGWQLGTGGALGGAAASDPRARFSNAAGLQRVVAFLPPSSPDVNLAITVRTPSADFTSLGSFGTAQQWAESLISSMDRSYMLKKTAPQNGRGMFSSSGGEPATIAKLIDVKDENGQYIVKYTVSREGSPTRVVVSAVALGVSPKGLRRFYTVNGSCTTETEGKYGEVLEKAVASFTAPNST